MKRTRWPSMILVAVAVGAVSNPVDACGGCFAPPASETSLVTGHRMAFAISEERTVLWDQFEYSGNPEEFSWVLPVARGAYLEASEDAWFEALENLTASRVSSPIPQCATDSSGCGFVGASAEDGSGSGAFDEGVLVVHRGTVGPYETVTLRSQSGSELYDWLDQNGYFVPSDIEPIIDAYVSEGADFVALKLRPGLGVQQMTPVRVVTPDGEPILPLRMVAAGTGQNVDIVLYVIGESRFSMPDLEESTIDRSALSWDFAAQESNYLELRAEALRNHFGHTYLTTYAKDGAFHETATDANGFPVFYTVGDTGAAYDNFSDLYFARATANDAALSADCQHVREALGSEDLVVAEEPRGGELEASRFECAEYSDIAAAMIGMHPSRVWLSRFELRLPREALVMDCVIEPSDEDSAVDNQMLAVRAENRPPGCPQPVFTSRVARGSGAPDSTVPWLLAAAVALGAVRRWRGTWR